MMDSEAHSESFPKRNLNKEEQESVFKAVSHGDLTTIQSLHSSGIDVTCVVDVGEWTALHSAAEKGHYNVASALIKWGANVNAAEEYNKRTPLHYAARYGHSDIFDLLVASGGDVNKEDKNGKTPLVMAENYKKQKVNSMQGKEEEHEELPPPKKRRLCKEDMMKIETAARTGDVTKLQELYSNGVDVTDVVSDQNEFTGLHWAALRGHYDVASVLLNWGTKVNVSGGISKVTPLQIAARNGYTDIVALLIDNGADANLKDAEELQDKIHHVLENYEESQLNDEMVKYMLEARKTGITIKVRYGKALLIGSCGAGKSSFFHLLMKKKHKQNNMSTGLADSHHVTVAMKTTAREISKTTGKEIEFVELDLDKEMLQLRSRLQEKVSNQSSPQLDSSSPQTIDTQILTGVETYLAANVSSEEDNQKDLSEVWEILTFIDSGGQPSYINMLPTINSSAMITFIVYNMEGGIKSLDNPVTVACRDRNGQNVFKPYPLSYNNLELIKNLIAFTNNMFLRKMQFLEKVCFKKGNCVSALALIGTHADKTDKSAIKEMDRVLDSTVADAELQHVWAQVNPDTECLIPIDNTTAGQDYEDRNAGKIRERLHEILQEQDIYDVPIVWILIELEIRKLCQKRNCSIISYNEVLEICKQKDLSTDQTFIKNGLRFHHLFGVLLYYENVEGMKNVIITDHQWLLDRLTAIVAHSYEANKDTATKNNFMYRGILDEKLLDKLDLSSEFVNNHMEALNIKKSFLNLLEHLKILTPIRSHKGFVQYFMPSLLPSCDLNSKQQNILESYGMSMTDDGFTIEPLLIQFTLDDIDDKSGTLPRGVFCCLAVELLQDKFKENVQWRKDMSNLGVFQNLITFYKSDNCYITLVDKIFYLEVHIRRKEKILNSSCYQIYSDIKDALNQVGKQLGLFNFSLSYGFLCMCKDCNQKETHLTKFTPNEDEYCCCYYSKRTKLTRSHTIWFEDASKKLSQPDDNIQPQVDTSDISATELTVFEKNYGNLCNTMTDIDVLLKYFVTEKTITTEEEEKITKCDTKSEKVRTLLSYISCPLQARNKDGFCVMLKIMKEHGTKPTRELAKQMEFSTTSIASNIETKQGYISDINAEMKVLENNHGKLQDTMIDVDNLVKYFVTENYITTNEEEKIKTCATNSEKVRVLLTNISGPLKAGYKEVFYDMLKIMKEHGTKPTQDLAKSMESSVET